MSIAAGSGTLFPAALPPYPVRRFSVAEYEELGRLGMLTEDDNVELLEGWIVPKMTKHPRHDGTIDLIQHLLSRMLPEGWHIRVQNVLKTADSMPEPDLAVVRGRPGDYRQRHPEGRDVGLIIEVAEATVGRDRRKAVIYAKAGIPHYWIVNLDDGQIELYGAPWSDEREGGYQFQEVVRGNEILTLQLDGRSVGTLRAGDILG